MDTREKHMMTTSEMIEEDFKFYLKDTSFHYIKNMPEIQEKSILLPVSEFNLKLKDVVKDPYYNGAFLTTTAHLTYRNMKIYPNQFHDFAPKPLYRVNIVIYMNRGSCLRIYFDDMLIRLVSSGFINKWGSKFIEERYLKKPVNDELKILSMEQLEGAFQLLIGGLLMGFIAFCCENLIGRKSMQKFKKFLGYQQLWQIYFRNLRIIKAKY